MIEGAWLVPGFGTPDTNRTCDLPLRRGLLYPLSYRGAGGNLTGTSGCAYTGLALPYSQL